MPGASRVEQARLDSTCRLDCLEGSAVIDLGPHELWDEPCEGLPEEEAAWEWDLVSGQEGGPTKNPPDKRKGWKRWYFVYHEPTCKNTKVSADCEPGSGKWFNPHRSSGEP